MSQLLSLPLAFLSGAMMDTRLMPSWIETVARYNPLDWAVLVSREALSSSPSWAWSFRVGERCWFWRW